MRAIKSQYSIAELTQAFIANRKGTGSCIFIAFDILSYKKTCSCLRSLLILSYATHIHIFRGSGYGRNEHASDTAVFGGYQR